MGGPTLATWVTVQLAPVNLLPRRPNPDSGLVLLNAVHR